MAMIFSDPEESSVGAADSARDGPVAAAFQLKRLRRLLQSTCAALLERAATLRQDELALVERRFRAGETSEVDAARAHRARNRARRRDGGDAPPRRTRTCTGGAARQAAAVESARRVAQLSASRYRNGMVSQLEQIDAERSVLASQRAALAVERERALATVGLIRAFGGGWSS